MPAPLAALAWRAVRGYRVLLGPTAQALDGRSMRQRMRSSLRKNDAALRAWMKFKLQCHAGLLIEVEAHTASDPPAPQPTACRALSTTFRRISRDS